MIWWINLNFSIKWKMNKSMEIFFVKHSLFRWSENVSSIWWKMWSIFVRFFVGLGLARFLVKTLSIFSVIEQNFWACNKEKKYKSLEGFKVLIELRTNEELLLYNQKVLGRIIRSRTMLHMEVNCLFRLHHLDSQFYLKFFIPFSVSPNIKTSSQRFY